MRYNPGMTIRPRLGSISLLLVWLVAFACERRQAPLRFDDSLMARSRARGAALTQRADVSAALDRFLERLIAEPRVAAAAAKLGDELAGAPAVAKGLAALEQTLTGDPAIGQAVAEMMARHPHWTEAELGAAVEKRIMDGWVRVPADQLGAQVIRVVGRAGGGPAGQAFIAHLEARFGRALSGYLDGPDTMRRWKQRLIELNGGTVPDARRATDLLLDNLWDLDRVAPIVIAFLDDPEVVTAAGDALAAALELDVVRVALVDAAAQTLNDPAMPARVQRVLAVLLAEDPTPAQVLAAVEPLLGAASVERALANVLTVVLQERRVRDGVDQLLVRLGRQPSVRALAERLVHQW